MWNLLILDPLVNLLIWLYGIFGNNYLIALVILTVLIRMALFPLTARQVKSTTGMQEIQPKMQKIREKYKDDPETMQAQVMELYREHGINPLGGCLPTLVQLPILIGLYQAITRSLAATPLQIIDLSQHIYYNVPAFLPDPISLLPLESRVLGLDLSAPNRLILPILVVATTFLSQRLLTPPSTDPQQAAMTRSLQLMMPLLIGFYSTVFPAGLSIYWVTSNVIGIAQYAVLGRASLQNLFGTEDGSFSLAGFLGLPQQEEEQPQRGRGSSRSRSRSKSKSKSKSRSRSK
ncbi:MAG: membrane protein insertase YidC [Chloroflexi bacterium]|nr:membrane protein insertase YidC [Chloroflexota bacterium]